MIQYLIVVVLVALMASFMVLILTKWGVVEWLQVHGDELLSKMASCTFCLSFWSCVIVSLVVVIGTDNILYLGIPFFAAPITRFFSS